MSVPHPPGAQLATWIQVDAPALIAAGSAALCLGLLGNFLVLRRQALLGDALSHAVLPGLVIAWLITGTRSAPVMLLGALAAAGLAVVLIDLVGRATRLEPSAALGVVFSLMFALGVLLVSTPAARKVDLDPDCVLFGQLESQIWTLPRGATPFSIEHLAQLPRGVWMPTCMCALTLAVLWIGYRPLRRATFDPAFAAVAGNRPGLWQQLTMVLVAVAAVAAFEAMGSVLVIALLVCPAATARLLTHRFAAQLLVSAGAALLAVGLGYGTAIFASPAVGQALDIPGLQGSLHGAGTIALTSGAIFLLVRWWAGKAHRAGHPAATSAAP